MANRHGGRTIIRSKPRSMVWANVLTHLAGPGITTKTVVGTSNNGLLTLETITLIRTRGDLLLQFDPASIADMVQVGIGLAVTSADAFVVGGSTAVPGPLTDPEWDWVYHRLVSFGPAIAAAQTETALPQHFREAVDSKAMRKMKDNQALCWVAEAVVISGGGDVDVFVQGRHLFKVA